ncbi:hypothetical protein PP754_gp040 [Pectobacterium phage Possum]|uniref:Uncharacterized protein n=1 Tax=Pectobacterium phage Possum TaxID=2686301 RepID=A0A7T0LW03_9CAUD|nr:hypothetical protein PP754_gp040 [Pectobacterium phage Possum]QPL10881.1 hypothetical protein Possum_00040 [Pectobacterium phage Possum]QPL10983.1 hypothetical protein Horatius_00040 [Pectobacterium phage Horatius]
MSIIHTFASLPESLRGLAIELATTRARQDQYRDLRDIVEEAVYAAAAAADLEVNVKPRVAADPAKPGAEETATMQAEPAGPNPGYKDPGTLDTKGDDTLDALGYFLKTLLSAAETEKHCGRPECQACNRTFGKLKVTKPVNKLRFQQVDHKDGAFGPVDIYRSALKDDVYAIMNRGKTALVESSNIELMSYQAAVEIVRVHGKADRSIVG